MRKFAALVLPLAIAFTLPPARSQEPVPPPRPPSPEASIGFRMGADNKLVKWAQVVDYARLIDGLSDRVEVVELGRSTEDRPLIAAIVSSPETIASLAKHQEAQRQIALPDNVATPVDPAGSKVVVLITCSIHSSETASTHMALELLHELATSDDPRTKEILEKTILLLVPSVNPDGVDIVADWYERSLGQSWEGSGLPRLYHPYAGHDTNRDWFMLNLKETQHLTRFLYQDWFPTITWDVHQMGSAGPRLFVPPFHDPINPNLDPRMNQAIRLVGAHLTADLAAERKRGVATGVMYDNWWNGGNRTVPQRHNMVGILTEAASVRLASPVFLDAGDLRGGGRGFDDHEPSVDFVDPWPGGWWRLRDIVEYELTCARSLLTLAARYGPFFQSNYASMARSSLQAGHDGPPYAWVVPADQRDPGTAADLVRILVDTGIRAFRSEEPFTTAGREFPAGSWVLPAAQPYRGHLKDMMELQTYPNRLGPNGTPERPYDVAGWTLPLQFGVESVSIETPLPDGLNLRPVDTPALPARPIPGAEAPAFYVMAMESLSDHVLLNRLLAAGQTVERYSTAVDIGDTAPKTSLKAGAVRVTKSDKVLELYREMISQPRLRPQLVAASGSQNYAESSGKAQPAKPSRVAIYQPWMPSMDEGWTRLVLEQFEFDYATVHNADIRAGGLRERFDVIVVPSIGTGTLRQGYSPDETEPAYVGGLGTEGLAAIREFVESGGTLVCLEASCPLFIQQFELPVKEVLEELGDSKFYCPGSILRLKTTGDSLLTAGLPDTFAAYFAGSLAFEVERAGADVKVVARYANSDVLQSGWLLGEEHLKGRAAVVEAKRGAGRVILFGFPPQHRGQPRGTFPLLFNSLRTWGD